MRLVGIYIFICDSCLFTPLFVLCRCRSSFIRLFNQVDECVFWRLPPQLAPKGFFRN